MRTTRRRRSSMQTGMQGASATVASASARPLSAPPRCSSRLRHTSSLLGIRKLQSTWSRSTTGQTMASSCPFHLRSFSAAWRIGSGSWARPSAARCFARTHFALCLALSLLAFVQSPGCWRRPRTTRNQWLPSMPLPALALHSSCLWREVARCGTTWAAAGKRSTGRWRERRHGRGVAPAIQFKQLSKSRSRAKASRMVSIAALHPHVIRVELDFASHLAAVWYCTGP
mmetsp:Transcript_59924/g.151928  ORF Transcript_59924/g.151928 Transcript_59924/m.151928 type:complete len:228 (-) Transcript_59924:53-736(-)